MALGQGSHTPADWREAYFHTTPFQVCGKQQCSGLLDQLPAHRAAMLGLRNGPDALALAALSALLAV